MLTGAFLKIVWGLCAFLLSAGAANADVWWLERAFVRSAKLANVIGPTDDRVWLTPEAGEKLGLSAAEVLQIQDSTGFINCRGAQGSAALVFDNRHVITAVHVIVDKNDPKKKFRQGCAFYAHDPMKRYVAHPLLLSEDSYRAGTLDTDKSPGGDWAIIKLAKPVARGTPFAIGDERIWKVRNSIIAISSIQRDKPGPIHKDNPGLPLAQKCTIRALLKGNGSRGFRSDCDVEPGGSGGVSIMRIDGNLVLAGVFIRAAKGENFKPYAPGNTTVAISVNDAVVAAIFDLAAGGIKPSQHQKSALLAGEIGDDLDEATRAVALRTETRALNDFMSTAMTRWTAKRVTGYVLPLPHDGPPLARDRCRSFMHAVVYAPDRIKSAKGRVCRTNNGGWALASDELKNEARAPAPGARAPQCASAGQGSQGTLASPCQ